MTDRPPMDPERIASLLDGSLSPAERDAALRELLQDPDALERFVETARLRLEFADRLDEVSALTAGSSTPVAAPATVPAHRNWRRWTLLAPLAGAAAVIAVLLVQRLGDRRDPSLLELATLVVSSPGPAASFTANLAGLWAEPGWSVVRGEPGVAAASPRLAFRQGVLLAHLRIALDWQDANTAAHAARDVATQLRSLSGGGPLALRTENLRERIEAGVAATETRPDLDAVAREIASLSASPVWLELGVWVGIARIASLSGSRNFFETRGPATAQLARLIATLENADYPGSEEYRARVLETLRTLDSALRTNVEGPAIRDAIAAVIVAAAG